MNDGSTLETQFTANAWDSIISFATGIPVSLDGSSLDLEFADGVNVAAQLGRTIHIFDWTGVIPTGTFTVASPYVGRLAALHHRQRDAPCHTGTVCAYSFCLRCVGNWLTLWT